MNKQETITYPPSWDLVGRHEVFPEASHDEIARFNFLANMNRHLAETLGAGNKKAYDCRVKPQLVKDLGREPASRHEVRRGMNKDPFHRFWSALKRNTMEQRQQAGRSVVLRQIDNLIEKAKTLTEEAGTLSLDPSVGLPRYVEGVDHHCMPGSYHTALKADDVSAGANYDCGLFVTTGGALGAFSDGGGEAVARFVRGAYPDFKPERILDVGCTVGHNLVPIAKAFPDSEVIGIDVGAPVLRYGAARAKSLGVENAKFVQMSAEDLSKFEDNSFDWVQTTMFLHETSNTGMARMMDEFYRILKPGGLLFHVEQPQYSDDMPVYEQFIRDWDAFNNNEPFWSKLHELDLEQLMVKAGFAADDQFMVPVKAVVDSSIFPVAETGEREDHGRAAAWHAFGAWKAVAGDKS